MFESVLIANRGEIACRIIRTCQRLGVRSIAVFSDADRHARHVLEADEAHRIGPAEAGKSYLDAAAIMRAAQASGAAAIHPGYGFLSEATGLVRRCDEQGVTWVGPRAELIEQMGSKTLAKGIAARAGIALVPGYHGTDQSAARLEAEASTIGYPVLIKASAGGGGKGMRRVDRRADFAAQLALAKQESLRAFGDDTVLIERLIQQPRHLEVQLAGDQHGGLIHLFERECSIQRNYQKVIEEAPAAWLDAATRAKLFDYALRLGKEIRYDSLGTVEFVLDAGGGEPYFLEMNTRLQVEHPVTEQVTGLDLVELQLRIAAGERLAFAQCDIVCSGWAIEARINAENPARDYRPELGDIVEYHSPDLAGEPALPGVRVDSGVRAGSTVTPWYDSMLAKVIGYGPSRAAARRRLLAGLDSYETLGIGTTQAFVGAVLNHPRFLAAPLTTGFIGDNFPAGWQPEERIRELALAVAGFCALHDWQPPGSAPGPHAGAARATAPAGPWRAADGFRNVGKHANQGRARWHVELDGDASTVSLARRGARWRVWVGATELQLVIGFDGPSHVRVSVVDGERTPNTPAAAAGRDYRFGMSRDADGQHYLSHGGVRWLAAVSAELQQLAAVAGSASVAGGKILATLPGIVTAVNVEIGQTVAQGDVVVVMEAMKLIFSLAAPSAGRVAALHCAVGQTVANAQLLVEIELPEAAAAA